MEDQVAILMMDLEKTMQKRYSSETEEHTFMFDSWAQVMYVLSVGILASILIILYLITLYKVCKGSGFAFIITLIVLLVFSNLGYIGTSTFDHKAGYLANHHYYYPDDYFDVESFINLLQTSSIFVIFRDGCMNEAIWLFSYRYWTISFVIPWQIN